MDIVQETIVDQIEITSENDVQVRFKLIVRDGDNVIAAKYHRSGFNRDLPNSVTLQMYEVNTHLLSMGAQPVSQAEIDRIMVFTDAAWGLGSKQA